MTLRDHEAPSSGKGGGGRRAPPLPPQDQELRCRGGVLSQACAPPPGPASAPRDRTSLLSDLRGEFPGPGGDLDEPRLKTALGWLARLHAGFWEAPDEDVSGLWRPQGSNWHLDKRREKFDIGEVIIQVCSSAWNYLMGLDLMMSTT